MSHSRGLSPAARWGGVPKVAELLPLPVGVLLVASIGWCWGGVPKKLSQNPPWGGVPKVRVVLQKVVPESPLLDGVVFLKLGWCSKSCPRILDGVVFQKLGCCSKKLSQNPHSVYYLLTDLTIIVHHNDHREIFQMYLDISIKS